MELTDDGRQFLSRALEIENAIEKARNTTRSNDLAGEITLAASSTVVGYFLPEHIHRLSELHPRLRVSIVELDRPQIMTRLLAGDFPLALLVTTKVRDPGIRTQTLFDSRRRLWVAADHAMLQRQEVHLADVVDEPLMLLTVDEAADAAARYWGHYGLKPNIRLRSTSIEAIRSMVANGQGVAIASDMQYRPWSLEGKRVETVLLADPIEPLSIGMAWPVAAPVAPATQLIIDYFRKRYLEPPVRHKGARR
jgi:DNA-binding transcriptional LysR family regulator